MTLTPELRAKAVVERYAKSQALLGRMASKFRPNASLEEMLASEIRQAVHDAIDKAVGIIDEAQEAFKAEVSLDADDLQASEHLRMMCFAMEFGNAFSSDIRSLKQ